MSVDASVDLVWGDGEHKFRFAIGQFRELQEKVNIRRIAIGANPVGPMMLLNSLRLNDAWPDDVRDVIRLGLIGGGMKPPDAHRQMVNYFDGTPLLTHMKTAHAILLTGMVGALDDPIDIKKKSKETSTNQSDSPGSTAQVLQ